MKTAKKLRLLLLVAGAGVLVGMMGAGCRKEPEKPVVPASRLDEPSFRARIREQGGVQKKLAARRADLESQLAACAKDPARAAERKRLSAELAAVQKEIQLQARAMRETARAALRRQAQDREDVRQGRAKYAPAKKPAGNK